MSSKIEFVQRESAFQRRLYTFAVINREHIDIKEFLLDVFDYFDAEVRGILELHYIIKLNGNFSAVFEKAIESSDLKEKQTIYINSQTAVIDVDTDLSQFYE